MRRSSESSKGADMAVRIHPLPGINAEVSRVGSLATNEAPIQHYYVCDAEAELPSSGTLKPGDMAYAKDSKRFFVYNGAWHDALSRASMSYTEDVASYSSGAPHNLCTSPEHMMDGVTTIEVEVYVPRVFAGQSGTNMKVDLYDVTLATYLGRIAWFTGVVGENRVRFSRRYVPAVGSHRWAMRVDVTGGTWEINADDGNAQTEYGPMWLRVSRA
jgi:hypothetical protein